MARLINLATPESGVTDGMELSFRAPCDCSDVTGITLDGKEYVLVDTSGESLMGCSKYFVKDAILTVIIDMTNSKATLLNPRVNTYTKTLGTSEDTASATGSVWARVKQLQSDVSDKAPTTHTHTKSQITNFAHTHDERYYTEDEIDAKLDGKASKSHSHTKLDITDFAHTHDDRYYTETEVDTKLNGKASNDHTHDEISNHETRVSAIETWKNGLYDGTGAVPVASKLGSTLSQHTVKDGFVFTGNVSVGKSYIILVQPTDQSDIETMFIPYLPKTSYNEIRSSKSFNGYYCNVSSNYGVSCIQLRTPEGTVLTAPYRVWGREI